MVSSIIESINQKYIKKEDENNVKLYKYEGVDHSLLYNHIFTHIANRCI